MTAATLIILGLGNPGRAYAGTRHNAGMLFLDYLAPEAEWRREKLGEYERAEFSLETGQICLLVKPQTFMNRSGESLRFLQKRYPELTGAQLVVAHDDLDLKFGTWKTQFGRGPHGHHGLESLYQARGGSADFWHYRIGIEARAGATQGEATNLPKIRGQDYVLQRFTVNELSELEVVFAALAKQLRALH